MNSHTHTHTHTHTHKHTQTHADEGLDDLAHSHTSSARGRVRAAGLVNPECIRVVGVPPSHGPSEGGVDTRLVQAGERSQRATQASARPGSVRECQFRHGGWLLLLCLTMGKTGKLRGRLKRAWHVAAAAALLSREFDMPGLAYSQPSGNGDFGTRGIGTVVASPSVHRLDVGRRSSPPVVTSCPRRA